MKQTNQPSSGRDGGASRGRRLLELFPFSRPTEFDCNPNDWTTACIKVEGSRERLQGLEAASIARAIDSTVCTRTQQLHICKR